ncbi:mismatch repair protein PMS1 [Novymonas esmeraldas]|uniref:Mismatch repair protein PMS1 n=1 Tax=Novymonas esmeraldas TaxID=1808958 RepID=A0AAW0ERS9_9TRYP
MITRLDGASARKIAAGQVITDLTSVVKELLENALDAEASTVTVRLIHFGIDEIVVEDDGAGMSIGRLIDLETGAVMDGAATPLLSCRATTKQRQLDLGGDDVGDENTVAATTEADASLGFRGEALHSLAHMSEVAVETRSADTGAFTVRLTYNSVAHTSHLEALRLRDSCGTTVTVRHLFRHLPVRHREFVKSCRKQLSAATNTARQYAVSHPRLRLLMQHQETPTSAVVTLVSLTGSGDPTRSITDAYGGLCISRMQHVDWTLSFGTLTGFVSKVSSGGRLSSDHQVFALDGRLVDLPRLSKAIGDAFTQCLPNASQRLHVAFFLQLRTNPSLQYDVNLTPNKRKVLLAQEERLADELYRCALQEFGLASQAIELSREQRIAQTHAADVRAADLTRLTRTPVSATAFTQFTFKKSKTDDADARDGGDGGEARSTAAMDLPKLGVLLYGDSASADGGEDDAATDSTPCLLPSSSSRSSSSSADAGEEGGSSKSSSCSGGCCDRGCCSSGGGGGVDGGVADVARADPALAVEVTRLSDEGGQRRSGGSCYHCTYPALSELVREPLSSDALETTTLPALPVKRGRGACRTLGAQTEDDLNQYFNKNSFKEMRVIGQFNHGFIIAVLPNGDVFIVDQHASDEKYNYERLVRAYVATPQPLVLPVSVAMDAHEVNLAMEHRLELLHHGFKVDRGGDDTKLLVGSLPVLPYDVVSASDVVELVQQLVDYGSITRPLRAVWHSMATKACRSSIMIGTPLTLKRMKLILERLGELEQPWNCPHGRPTLRLLGNLTDLSREGGMPLQ